MDLYSVVLFAHIVGALLLFATLTVEGLSYRFGFDAARLNRVVGPITLVLILFPGLYLMKAQWGWTGWVITGITAYVLIAGLGAFTGISVMRGTMNRRTALMSWLIRIGMALGVVFDMTVKPNLLVSTAVVAAGLLAGAAAGLLTRSEARTA